MAAKCKRMAPKSSGVSVSKNEPNNSAGGRLEDLTVQRMVDETLAMLAEDVMKRIPLMDTFDDVDKFHSMICHVCCEEDETDFEGVYDYNTKRFVDKSWLNRSDRSKNQEIIDQAILMASLYVTLCILVKQNVNER